MTADTSPNVPQDEGAVSRRQKLRAFVEAITYRPRFAAFIVALGVLTAVLEGIGLTFIIPIIDFIQSGQGSEEPGRILQVFLTVYRVAGIPFTLEYVIGGVAAAMTLRYLSSFFLNWLRGVLQLSYERHLRNQLFRKGLDAEIAFVNREGTDDILNAMITESKASSKVIKRAVSAFELVLLTGVYLAIALWISPVLTLLAIAVLGGVSFFLRSVLSSGFDLGDRVATANERLQEIAQASMIGLRDIRIFNLADELYDEYTDALDQYTQSKVLIRRNRAALNQFHNLIVAVFVFVLIYVALRFANLSFGELGLFLFAIFQLGPKVSTLNKRVYRVEENLPHMVRTHAFMTNLDANQERSSGTSAVPDPVDEVAFDEVSFAYEEETVLDEVSFAVERGEFVGFVGQSGAGKSTIVSLLGQFYTPDAGEIRADGVPISEVEPSDWRQRLAVVRQSPYVFNDTLRYNLTIGNRDATQAEIERVCEIAKVDEFFDDLPNGYDSQLGDDGVRLSGGQKQRVALARALLRDADLLILDEATSDLDSNLEQEVQRSIESMDRDYAIVAIAHRLSTVERADRIYTMENGQITEQGDHTELVERDGTYATLYQIQSGD